MSYEIRATIEMLRGSAETVDNNANTIRREVEAVRQLLDALRPSFTGLRSERFFSRFDQDYQSMQEWDRVVRSFAEEMRGAADRFQAVENKD